MKGNMMASLIPGTVPGSMFSNDVKMPEPPESASDFTVTGRLRELEVARDSLDKAISTLYSRLNTVIVPTEPSEKPSDTTVASPLMSDVASSIDSAVVHVYTMRNTVNRLTDSINL